MPALTEPLQIRDVTLRNRLWFPPVARDQATPDGLATDAHVEAYDALARGGVGTVVVEHSFVLADGRYSARQLGVDRDETIPGLARIAAAIRTGGATPILQISFAGARTSVGRRVGPSAIPLPGEDEAPEELPAAEIPSVVEAFGRAATRARRAGFAGAEIHSAHGFLLSEFLSPLANRRTDGYGGHLRARTRLALEVVEACRTSAAAGFLIGLRLGADDGLPGGLVPDNAARVATWLAQAGVDYVSVSGGLCGSRPKSAAGVQGYYFPQAELVRAAVTVPVVGVGGVTDPAVARRGIEENRRDLVAVGRALVADPLWARRALAAA